MTDNAGDVMQTADGGYLLTGSTDSYGASNYDAYLLKTNSAGSIQWFRLYRVDVSGSVKSSYGNAVQQTSDGGYILAGQTFGVFGNNDIYILRTDGNGVV